MHAFPFLAALPLCLFPALLSAQLLLPDASPPARVEQRIGLTDVTLQYARPAVKGRKIFGELIPYGEVWRLGANAATRISFSKAVRVGDASVPAGAYALYAVPGEKEWTWIVYGDTALWGARGYNPAKDLARIATPAEKLPERIESMELRWMNIRPQYAELVLEWEYTRVRLPFHFDTDAQVRELVATALAGKPSGDDYYRAARYYFDNDLDRKQARQWINRKVEMDGEQFGILRYKALIEYADGDTVAAMRTMERSLELARLAYNDHYIRMNEQSLREWTLRPSALPASEIVRRSIAYHDPDGAWAAERFRFRLWETRPNGHYRSSTVVIDNGNDEFQLWRQDGPDHIVRHSGPTGCTVTINGAEKQFVEAMDINILRCRDNERYRNYYTYLYGLPMKLLDAGTVIAPQARLRYFFGEEYHEVKVTYDPDTGSDTWYFYFDTATFALRGYRFYHDEAQNDGEYILLEDEARVGPLRIPKRRSWYTHRERLFLGTDVILEGE